MTAKKLVLNNKLVGQLMFLTLFILAAVFYLERTTFADPCYAFFNLLYYQCHISETGRYAAVIPQTLVLLGIKMHLPLKALLLIYSGSFILLYYLVFLVIAYGFKLDRIALAVPLVLMMGVKHSFFWISTETHQALVYTVLFYAFLIWSHQFRQRPLVRTARLIIAAGIMLLCFFSHPVALFTVLFVLGFFMIDNRLWFKPEGYLLAGMITVLAVIKFMTSSPTGYEAVFFREFSGFFGKITRLGDSESLKFLLSRIPTLYLFPTLMLGITAAWYAANRQFVKLACYLVSVLMFSLILFITFNLWFLSFIQEKNLMGLGIFLLIPFLKDVVFTDDRKKIASQVFLILLFLFAVANVLHASFSYRERISYTRKIIRWVRHYPEKKFVLGGNMYDPAVVKVTWGFAAETLILSSLESPDSSVSLYIDNEAGKLQENTRFDDPSLFICVPWSKNLETGRLDRRWFNLGRSGYRKLTESDLVTGKKILLYSNGFDGSSSGSPGDITLAGNSGNPYLLLKEEQGPCCIKRYGDLKAGSAVAVEASVRVFPFDTTGTGSLALEIIQEHGHLVYARYCSGSLPGSLKPRRWDTVTVSGIIRSVDAGDILKVCIRNPQKKTVGIDDLAVSYRTVWP